MLILCFSLKDGIPCFELTVARWCSYALASSATTRTTAGDIRRPWPGFCRARYDPDLTSALRDLAETIAHVKNYITHAQQRGCINVCIASYGEKKSITLRSFWVE